MPVNFDFKTSDVQDLTYFIENKIRSYSGQTRTVQVKALMETLNFELNQKRLPLNFMIFNLEQTYWQQLQGVHFFKTFDLDGTKFAVWIFESGRFENTGRGTHANWGMGGYNGGNRQDTGETVTGGMMGRHVEFFPINL